MNFFLPPQYIVLEPAKMRYFQLKNAIYCGRVKLAFPSKIAYHVRSTAGHRTHPTGSAVPPRRVAPQGTSRRVPCQVNTAQSKPGRWETAVKRVVCTTDEPTACTAYTNRGWRTRAKLKGRYWCTLKSKHRAVRIQLHRRVTVVLPAPTA